MQIIQSLIIILFEAICCMLYLNIFFHKKNYLNKFFVKLIPFFLTAGFFCVAYLISNFLLKSILIVTVMIIVVQIYYNATTFKTIVLSAIFYGILLGIDYLLLLILNLFSSHGSQNMFSNPVSGTLLALLCKIFLLLIVVCIRKLWNKEDNLDMISNKEWFYLSSFPAITILSMIGMFYGTSYVDEEVLNLFLFIAFGLVSMNFLVFFLIHDLINREAAIQDTRLIQERSKNQIQVYRKMNDTYEKQRKKLHDYKNQMICIQGMLANGKQEETFDYISSLTNNLVKDMDIVHTNSAVVDSIINQKYKYAQEKNITFIMMVSDLSSLAVDEIDLVIILSNILDNAIEACEKLEENRIIKLKIAIENEQLIISVQNPVEEPVQIIDNKIVTTKADKNEHGIGLKNICSSVGNYSGTYTVRYKGGWFYITVLIPF